MVSSSVVGSGLLHIDDDVVLLLQHIDADDEDEEDADETEDRIDIVSQRWRCGLESWTCFSIYDNDEGQLFILDML